MYSNLILTRFDCVEYVVHVIIGWSVAVRVVSIVVVSDGDNPNLIRHNNACGIWICIK